MAAAAVAVEDKVAVMETPTVVERVEEAMAVEDTAVEAVTRPAEDMATRARASLRYEMTFPVKAALVELVCAIEAAPQGQAHFSKSISHTAEREAKLSKLDAPNTLQTYTLSKSSNHLSKSSRDVMLWTLHSIYERWTRAIRSKGSQILSCTPSRQAAATGMSYLCAEKGLRCCL
eukprot:scaffold2207_cov370-Prasinococcus_capsulatus_cf.AAC.1